MVPSHPSQLFMLMMCSDWGSTSVIMVIRDFIFQFIILTLSFLLYNRQAFLAYIRFYFFSLPIKNYASKLSISPNA